MWLFFFLTKIKLPSTTTSKEIQAADKIGNIKYFCKKN